MSAIGKRGSSVMRASDIYAKKSTKSGMPGEDDSKSRKVLRQDERQRKTHTLSGCSDKDHMQHQSQKEI